MNYKIVKRSEKRFATVYNSSWKIQSYGDDNLYPQRMADIIACSPTGSTCCERYRTFIEGNGMLSDDIAYYICNNMGDSLDDIFHMIAYDVAYSAGLALHINYNLKGQITEIQHIPFKDCRLAEEDDRGRVPFIKVHPDWEGRKTRNGKTVQVSARNIRAFYPFNPNPKVVLAQMNEDDGIEHYRGQILWVSLGGRNNYPKPIYDKVVTELSVDEGISNVKYRNVRNNFLLSGMLIHKKGSTIGVDEEGNEIINDNDDGFEESLRQFQGDVNACSLMDVTVNQEEDVPKFVSVEGTNFDKKFQATESSTVERIYSAFGQEPWFCIRTGKTGFSGEILRQAYEYYNSYVDNERRVITRTFQRIFANWYDKKMNDADYTIQPLVYQYNYSNGNLDKIEQENATTGTFNNGGAPT